MTAWTLIKGAGAGLIGGLAGTAAITATQAIHKKLQGKPLEDRTPAKAVQKALPVKAEDAKDERILAQAAHWGYGAAWGLAPWLLDLARLPPAAAIAVETVAIQGAAMAMLPALEVAPPLRQWGAAEISGETTHHAIYAAVSTLVYRRLAPAARTRGQRRASQPRPKRTARS